MTGCHLEKIMEPLKLHELYFSLKRIKTHVIQLRIYSYIASYMAAGSTSELQGLLQHRYNQS